MTESPGSTSSRSPLIPRHIAIVMDGNGRWAEQRGLPRKDGHRAGAEAARKVIDAAGKLGVDVLTLYSFSSENWKRPAEEVDALMSLCVEYCTNEAESLHEENIRVRTIGRTGELPEHARDALAALEAITADCTGPTLCLAINYGSRAELLDATRAIAEAVAAGELRPCDVNEADIASRLYAPDLPDPDLFIRTGGNHRLSNFLLWQLSYAELVVTDTLWPEFDDAGLRQAIEEFTHRDRRFGGISNTRGVAPQAESH